MYELPFGTKFRGRKLGGEMALDVYESYLSFSVDLRKRHTIREVKGSEWGLYGHMLKNAFVPGYMSVQGSHYPLLHLSTWMEADHPDIFERFSFAGGKQNLLPLLSSSFTDPYAFSLFLGEVIDFRKQIFGQEPESGYGLMGYVISYGPQTSFSNRLYWDNWWEFKWKIKGLKEYDQKERIWNMLIGYIAHENPEFPNTLIFETERQLKSRAKKITLLENTLVSANFSLAPDLPLKTILTKQVFGVALGIFYPLGSKLFAKVSGGLRRELQRENSNLKENYVIYFSPTLTF